MALSTIQFDKVVYWAGGGGAAGVTFSKTDAFLGSPEVAAVLSVLEGTGESDILTYVLSWPNDPVADDIITFDYDSITGMYQDNLADPMADANVVIANCADPPD